MSPRLRIVRAEAVTANSVHDLNVFRLERCAQALEQMVVEVDAPVAAELDLAACGAVLVIDRDRARAAPEWLDELQQRLRGARPVAGNLQQARPFFSRAGEIVQRLGDDAQALQG